MLIFFGGEGGGLPHSQWQIFLGAGRFTVTATLVPTAMPLQGVRSHCKLIRHWRCLLNIKMIEGTPKGTGKQLTKLVHTVINLCILSCYLFQDLTPLSSSSLTLTSTRVPHTPTLKEITLDCRDKNDNVTQGDELRRIKTSRALKHPRSATTGALRYCIWHMIQYCGVILSFHVWSSFLFCWATCGGENIFSSKKLFTYCPKVFCFFCFPEWMTWN